MGLSDLLPIFAQSGALGLFALLLYLLMRLAINAHKQRADDFKAAWELEVKRSDVRDEQLQHILEAVRRNPAPTREAL